MTKRESVSLGSEALFNARANLYRPPIVTIATSNGAALMQFAVLYGACPIAAVRRMGMTPTHVYIHRGSLGKHAKADEIKIVVKGVGKLVQIKRTDGK